MSGGDTLSEDVTSPPNEVVAVVARKELREDESTRSDALATFRAWIKKNKDLDNIRTGQPPLCTFKKTQICLTNEFLLPTEQYFYKLICFIYE